MTLITTIGSGVPALGLSFGAAALAAGTVVGGLLLLTAAILIVADSRCAA